MSIELTEMITLFLKNQSFSTHFQVHAEKDPNGLATLAL